VIAITLACLIAFGLTVYATLPRPAGQTRHYRNVLARVAERRKQMLIYWWLTRPERKRA
jgi:hypothetical protein